MHCPVCGVKFGFVRWLGIMNPSRFSCHSCRTMLTTGRSGIQPTVDALVVGLLIAAQAIYLSAMKIWPPIPSLLLFIVAQSLFCIAYSWFIWRDTVLATARSEPGADERFRVAALFLVPAVACAGMLAFLAGSAGSLPFAQLFAGGSPQREMCLFLCGMSVISLLQMLLLVSPIHLPFAIRLLMSVIWIAVAIAGFCLVPAVLLVWIFPAWRVFRLLRFPVHCAA